MLACAYAGTLCGTVSHLLLTKKIPGHYYILTCDLLSLDPEESFTSFNLVCLSASISLIIIFTYKVHSATNVLYYIYIYTMYSVNDMNVKTALQTMHCPFTVIIY